jgi:small-conductance mechanosensitive channel/CRP-like cAMP-binding protein
MAPPSAISSWSVPSWSVVLPAFGLVLLLTLACRRRGLPLPPRTLPLLATVCLVVLHLVPLSLVPASTHLWLTIGVDLLLVLALIRLVLWLVLELPGGLGWWRPPPRLLLQLLLVAGGALAAVLLVNRVGRLDLMGLVTTSAVLTAVVGLAIQEPLKDLIAGLELQLSDDLRLGDLVEIAGGQARGRVESVTWRDTILRTFDGVRVVLPNTQVTNGILRNLSITGAVSDRFDVGLDYDLPPRAAMDLLERVVTNHPLVLQEPPPDVRVKAFADSAITYEVEVWFREPSDRVGLTLRSALLQQIWYALKREGRSIPFPVRELQRRPSDPAAAALAAPLPPQEGRLLLAGHSLFADLPPAELDCLLSHSRPVLFTVGEAIVREGATGRSLYQVITGRVEVLKEVQPGHTIHVAELGPGEVFGEMTLFQGLPRSATVRALEDSRLLRVDRAGVRELLERDPDLLERFAQLVNSRRRELESLGHEERQREASNLLEAMRKLFFALGGG